ncbi:Uncharacterised protein [Porphyromonas crevioricanis]|uniref:DUF6603 domain-containing protein n=2 Tax=Porphyromonas crevioricanis TaxID=393921 RepID=A0A2X4STL6_9PORP|nr:hypothetical protein PORCAN_1869 [Porphyromonas crevioricanis JCM 13913]SQH73181.1 Uncharacterised protein [Porphyromonas crevioricanis]
MSALPTHPTSLQGAERILSKIGLVLSKSKEALLKDLLQNISEYMPDKSELEDYSPKDFLSEVESGKFKFEDYVNGLFHRLGYDLSQFEKNRELFDLVKSCMAVLVKLGNVVQSLSTTVDWKSEIDLVLTNPSSAGSKAASFLTAAKKLYDQGGLGDSEVPTDEGLLGNIYSLLELIVDLFDIVRKFKDIEGEKLVSEYEGFLDFLDDNFFNKEFADRILDHILITILSNAKDVFSDDICALVDGASDISKYIREGIEEHLTRPVSEVVDEIKALEKEIAELESQLCDRAEELAKAAKEKGLQAVREVSSDLTVRLKTAKARLEELGNELFDDYNQFVNILNKIYVVLDFLKVFDKETIKVAKYIPNSIELPYSCIRADIDLVSQDFQAILSDAKKSVREVNDLLSDAVAKMKATAPTVEIQVIRWSRLKRLFTDPIDYLREIYPIESYDDAINLMEKVLKVMRAFNPQVPNIEDIQQFLHELLIRISEKIKDFGAQISNTEAVKNLEKFRDFIFDVLKVISEFGTAVRQELTEAYKNAKNEAKSVFDSLSSGVRKEIDLLITEGSSDIERLLFDSKLDINNEFFGRAFVDPFIRILKEKAAEHELFKNVDPDAWGKAIVVSGAKDANVLLNNFRPLLQSMDKMARALFEEEVWRNRLKGVIDDLGEEFEKQMENIPSSVKDVEKYGRDAIEKLLKGGLPNNPFSGFNIYRYFEIFRDAIEEILPDFGPLYYDKFLTAVESTVTSLTESSQIRGTLRSVSNTVDDYPDKLKSFSVDVFRAYLDHLLTSLYNNILKPYKNAIEKAVKTWLREELLPKAVASIRRNLPNIPDLREYEKLFNPENLKFAEQLIAIPQEAAEIDSWQDGLRFAIKFYKAVPTSVKKYFRELVDLPDFDFGAVKLPPYSLDVKNKFLCVTLYEYASSQKPSSSSISGNVSIKIIAFVGSRKIGESDKAGLYLLPMISGDFGVEINLGANHKLKLGASESMNGDFDFERVDEDAKKKLQDSQKLGVFLTTKPGDRLPSIIPLDEVSGSLKAYLELLFSRTENNKLMIFGPDPDKISDEDDSIASLSIMDYPQKIYVGYNEGFDAGYLGSLRDLELNLFLASMNDFFAKIFKKPIKVGLESLDIGYSVKDGFRINGDYLVQIPLDKNVDLNFVKFNNLMIELGGSPSNNLLADFNSSFTADFHGIAISFADLGFGIDVNVFNDKGGFGDFDIRPHFSFPDGIGISIDTKAVTGAGIIKWSKEKEEFLGAISIGVLNLCSVDALLLFRMRMPDGSKGFSFMAALSTTFKPGIQLGMGFQLTKIGGSLGINRRIDQDRLISATRDGTLGAVLFIDDIAQHLDTILGNITTYFPTQEEQVFFGFMTRITFSDVMEIDAGLFIQAPDPVVIIIAGGMHIGLSKSLDWLLSLNVYFLGMIDFSKGLSFDASLVDSHIVGIDLYGDVAFRMYWAGDTKGFLFSAGGFHPKYKPEAGFNVRDMRRIGMKLNYSVLKFSLDTYFAVTSNTVQFGARMEMDINLYICSISGFFEFNALFQFNPFLFMVEGSAGVKVKCCGITLLAVGIALELSGPARWHASGEATFRILFVKKRAHFSKTWGRALEGSEKKYISIFPIFEAGFTDNTNWQVFSNDVVDRLVSFSEIESEGLVAKPSDTIAFSQSGVPLGERMEKYGEAEPGDVCQIEMEKLCISGIELTKEDDYEFLSTSFAPALIKDLTDEEKLAAPSYQKMKSGFILTHGLQEEKGEGVEVKPAQERVCQFLDDDVWTKWQRYSVETSQTEWSTREALSTRKMGISALRNVNGPSDPLTRKFSKEIMNRKHSSSQRRNAEGIRRYILQSDCTLKRKARSFIDQLENV